MKIRLIALAGALLSLTVNDATFADQVINDDLIITQKECVGGSTGFGCVNNEIFGEEQLLLKEQAIRMRFDDTSTDTGFPANDWQLVVNDSGSGGVSKISIEDITGAKTPFTIQAGAPESAFFVDRFGQVGFGTSMPQVELHIKSVDQPGIVLEQLAGVVPARMWKLAGDEINFFIGEGNESPTMPLVIKVGTRTNTLTAVPGFVANTGFVGVNTDAPTSHLHLFGPANGDTFIGMGVNPGGGAASNCALNIGYAGTSFGQGKGFFNVRPCATGTPDLRFAIANATKMILDSDGLNVLGSIRSNGTQLNVPDYVFESSYELMSLPDLAAYLESENHLPDIPSAKDIKERGLDIGAMQMQLLRKVEELTLYTIEQDRKLSVLLDDNRDIKKQNQELNNRIRVIEQSSI